MDRLDAMKMLVTVVDAGSLSAAGRGLNVPLTTLSRKISALEARLGTHLLLRSTRRLALTDAGIAYVAAARRILDEVEEAERAAAGEFTLPRGAGAHRAGHVRAFACAAGRRGFSGGVP